MDKVLFPGSVRGQVDIPASKSQTIHALLIALFAKGVSTIRNPLICSDTQACLDFCRKLGARIEFRGNTVTIDSSVLSPEKNLEINCRNSGTTLFFATALGSTLNQDIRFTGDESLRRRPARALLASLSDLGVDIDAKAEFIQLFGNTEIKRIMFQIARGYPFYIVCVHATTLSPPVRAQK